MRSARAAPAGLLAVALMLVWAEHNGGYDADTWYWGALILLAGCGALVIARGHSLELSRWAVVTLAAFALYVGWSYLSIAWAGSPGDALAGSNRALLYLLLFTFMMLLPWTATELMWALVVFALGVGAIAIVLLARLASADRVASLVISGRLASPTGYFNATAALFMIAGLVATVLSARRELPGLVRGALACTAAASVELTLIVQSRGWLFTLPFVLIVALVLAREKLRTVAAAAFPVAAALIPLHRLLDVYQSQSPLALNAAAQRAGQACLVICGVIFVLGTIAAWADALSRRPPLTRQHRRRVGTALAVIAVAAACLGSVAATHGHPFRFVERQWNGFSHPPVAAGSGSHFATVGSGRYDFWRVSLDALAAHPLGGLGQDNFADYYITRRRTHEEPSWTHSLELRLLAHTGLIGFTLFIMFLVAALSLVRCAVRDDNRFRGAVAAAALMPLVVWLIHGSVDWFWELPALTGPALGFLGASVALGEARIRERRAAAAPQTNVLWKRPTRRMRRLLGPSAAAVAFAAGAVALGFPYVAVREESAAVNAAPSDPTAALRDLATAADLDPLSPVPGRLGGRIALDAGYYQTAEQRFAQAIAREPGGWFAWFGDGLAASRLGDVARARRDFAVALRIERYQPVIASALRRVGSHHPVTPAEGLRRIVLAQ